MAASGLSADNHFDGGTLYLDADVIANLGVRKTGGTIDTAGGSGFVISGDLTDYPDESGHLIATGGGVINLTGANTYTGGTTVTGGTILSVAGTGSLGTGGITLNAGTLATTAALSTNQTVTVVNDTSNVINTGNNAVSLSGGVSGGGALTITGGNTLALSGSSTYNGTLNVTGATKLIVGAPGSTGSISACSNVIVENGSTIGGNGTICSVNVKTTAHFAPGNSPGTLNVLGNLTLDNGSTFAAEIDGRTYVATGGAGSYDRVVVSGAYTASGTVSPILREITGSAINTFTPILGDTFTIVTAGTVNSEFEAVIQPTSGLGTNQRFDVLYAPTTVQLVVTPDSFATMARTAGLTQSAINAAGALDSLRPRAGARSGTMQSLFNDLYGESGAALGGIVTQLAGDVYANLVLANTQAARQTVRSISDTIGAGGNASGTLWMQYLGLWSPFRSDATSSGSSYKNNGFAIGANLVNSAKLRIGVAGNYQHSTVSNRTGAASIGDTYGVAGYVHAAPAGNLDLSAVVGIGRGDMVTTRSITGRTGTVTALSDAELFSFSANLKARYRLVQAGPVGVWAHTGLDLNDTRLDAISETASDANYALRLNRKSFKSSEGSIGLDLQYKSKHTSATVSGKLLHQLGETTAPTLTAQLGNASWQMHSTGVSRDAMTVGASYTRQLSNIISLRAAYDGIFGDRASTHQATAGVSVKF